MMTIHGSFINTNESLPWVYKVGKSHSSQLFEVTYCFIVALFWASKFQKGLVFEVMKSASLDLLDSFTFMNSFSFCVLAEIRSFHL
jgi:hypothetical protein